MVKAKKNIGIILAGGSGNRCGGDVPKQFLQVAGKSILEHTLAVFNNHTRIDEIAIVINPAYTTQVTEMIASNSFHKATRLLYGGVERYHSTLSALEAFQGTDYNLLIHDAVRPLVSERIINDVIEALNSYSAVNVAIPTTDTIVEVDETHEHITHIPDRTRLYNVQTPQGFDINTLKRAYGLAMKDKNFKTTDDCSVVKRYLPDTKIFLVKGDIFNLKLTFKEDIFLIGQLLKYNALQK